MIIVCYQSSQALNVQLVTADLILSPASMLTSWAYSGKMEGKKPITMYLHYAINTRSLLDKLGLMSAH